MQALSLKQGARGMGFSKKTMNTVMSPSGIQMTRFIMPFHGKVVMRMTLTDQVETVRGCRQMYTRLPAHALSGTS